MGNEKLKLYLRFPKKIDEELQVKNLCPFIEAVHLPRQKSARWCVIDFKTEKHREEALKILKKTKIEGKNIIVKPIKPKRKPLAERKTSSIKSIEKLLEN